MTTTAPTTTTTTDDRPMTARFKEGCWDLHEAAENAELPRKLLKGEISREEYAELVAQGYLVAKALDDAILRHRDNHPHMKALIDDAQLQTPYYEHDLRALNIDPDTVTPNDHTRRSLELIQRTESTDPANLFALHYVREGANNGNRFLAPKVAQRLDLTPGEGTKHLDPYGPEQPKRWAAFKATLDEQNFTPEQRDRLVQTARDMFLAVMAVNHGVVEAAG